MNTSTHFLEKTLIIGGFITSGLAWVYIAANYNDLPDQVVAHMDLQGNVNRYDSKNTLWFLAALFTGMQVLFLKLAASAKNWTTKKNDQISSLLAIPYLGLICFGICYTMIQKTQNPNFADGKMLLFFAIITVLLLVVLLIRTLKTLKQ